MKHAIDYFLLITNKQEAKWFVDLLIQNDRVVSDSYKETIYDEMEKQLLVNAIEETLKTNQKEINIYIEYSLNELIIQVKNPIVNHNIDWVSHKGGEHQGLGLTIIQEKVNLYNGIYKKQITEDTFISYIYISFHN